MSTALMVGVKKDACSSRRKQNASSTMLLYLVFSFDFNLEKLASAFSVWLITTLLHLLLFNGGR